MADAVTQIEVDLLATEVLAMTSGAISEKLKADIKSRSTLSPEGQHRFLLRVRDALEMSEVQDYMPEPAHVNGNGPGGASGVRKAASTNPWSKIGWSVSEQGRLCKTLGEDKAASMAKSAGCVLGSTRANPDFN